MPFTINTPGKWEDPKNIFKQELRLLMKKSSGSSYSIKMHNQPIYIYRTHPLKPTGQIFDGNEISAQIEINTFICV